MTDPIYVTRPFLPDLEEFVPMLEDIWASRNLTNHGPFLQRFEAALNIFLETEHILPVCNGMLALSAAIAASGIEGEVITTPYSFAATSHAISLAGLTPVFADLRSSDLNICPERIEEAITSRTSAIVAVHVYGNPCDVDALQKIGERHGLTVIYDAAHAFGVRFRGSSLLTRGDFATLSFHATKAFNTFEGGAVVSATARARQAVRNYSNFGIADELTIPTIGSNAKMSEFNAALGLLQLDHFERGRKLRKTIDMRYRQKLAHIEGLECLAIPDFTEPNFSYFPILLNESARITRDSLYEALKSAGIMARKYFSPLLSNLPMYRDLPSAQVANLPFANAAVERVLCLPIYPDLSVDDQHRIIDATRFAMTGSAKAG